MNILLDPLPEAAAVSGVDWPIRSGFYIGIQFELLMQDPDVPAWEKAGLALALYYPTVPDDVGGAIERVLWFYRCGRKDETPGTNGGGAPRRAYCFEEDAERIYSAFLRYYSIDLNTAEKLHWWKFRALFRGLPEECELCKIMGYRTAELSGLPKGQKEFYQKMRKRYALKNTGDAAAILSRAERDRQMKNYAARRFAEAERRGGKEAVLS